MEATEDTVFQAETLRGDVQNRIMDDVVRPMPGWVKMSEREQREVINSTARIASDLVREAVKLVAHRDFPHMIVSLGKWTVKEGIKLEVSGSDSVEEITKLASATSRRTISSASPRTRSHTGSQRSSFGRAGLGKEAVLKLWTDMRSSTRQRLGELPSTVRAWTIRRQWRLCPQWGKAGR